MIRVYDIESYPNFFSVAYQDVNSNNKGTYYIHEKHNNIKEIIELFTSDKSDWFIGYNSFFYDDRIIAYLIENKDHLLALDVELLAFELYNVSQEIISNHFRDGSIFHNHFKRFDLKRVGNINKSLKLVAVDLRHNKIQDLPYPFEHKVQLDEVDTILKYNNNDVDITKALYNELIKEVKLRQKLSQKYNINLMNEADSSIANRILEKDYKEITGLWFTEFKNSGTDRISVDLKDCIPDIIKFKTKPLQDLLFNIKNTTVTQDDDFEFKIIIGKTRYDILKGGIHSNMPSTIYEFTDEYDIIDADVASYYPRIIINYKFKPEHLNDKFLDLIEGYTSTRLIAKQNGDKVEADGLKIVINSIFGKFGSEFHWLRDIKSMYSTTLTGQLSLLMYIEELEINGFEVFYANTDGITTKVPKEKEELYYQISKEWEQHHGFELEFEKYKKCIIRDVNNYLWISEDDKPKYKGFFDITRHKDLRKSFDKPIVAHAVYKYFTENIPVKDTIEGGLDIHDFCMAQKAGSDFSIKFNYIENGKLQTKNLQKTNRYYVGRKGGHIYKEKDKKKIGIIAGEPVHLANDIDELKEIKEYNIKYQYYIKEAEKIIDLFNTRQTDLFL